MNFNTAIAIQLITTTASHGEVVPSCLLFAEVSGNREMPTDSCLPTYLPYLPSLPIGNRQQPANRIQPNRIQPAPTKARESELQTAITSI
ncbi:unnamed protein product [[Candida] boidinii]|uniref:Unnamed protein product n=1 Tax=Candida boidinii TaxID=5477 RepID=A0ACB5U090_CANBO|nr:unnamed protein product [[Candida] boidinii]